MQFSESLAILATGCGVIAGTFYLANRHFAGGVCFDKVDLSDKVIIITGSNCGIGFETAKALAKMNGHIIMACKKSAKTEHACEILKMASPSKKVEAMELDLSSLESIRSFVSDFKAKDIPLHILINNAGVVGGQTRKTTKDGFEMSFGINHLGHFLLTNLLLDKLKETKGRIVNVSTNLHKDFSIDFDDLQYETRKWHAMNEYSITKLMIVSFSIELQRRLEGTGVNVFSLHPGVVRTGIVREASLGMRIGFGLAVSIFGKNTKQGSQTSIYAAISPSLNEKGGSYLADCEISKASDEANNPEIAKKLWDISAEMVGLDK